MEYATVGIGVNTVAPGVVYTPLHGTLRRT
jgi:NAD(P)-dependent dehydrogenase (short-subunit alcohol dehydrogenase family)